MTGSDTEERGPGSRQHAVGVIPTLGSFEANEGFKAEQGPFTYSVFAVLSHQARDSRLAAIVLQSIVMSNARMDRQS